MFFCNDFVIIVGIHVGYFALAVTLHLFLSFMCIVVCSVHIENSANMCVREIADKNNISVNCLVFWL